jgi:hypothetical protein
MGVPIITADLIGYVTVTSFSEPMLGEYTETFSITSTPEPRTAWMVMLGLAPVAFWRRSIKIR